MRPLPLTAQNKADLIAFPERLTDTEVVTDARAPTPLERDSTCLDTPFNLVHARKMVTIQSLSLRESQTLRTNNPYRKFGLDGSALPA